MHVHYSTFINFQMENEMTKTDPEDETAFEPNPKKAKTDDSDSEEESCSICQETLADSSLFLAPCKHKFHFTCAVKMFAESKDGNRDTTCPLCRHSLAAEQTATAAAFELPNGPNPLYLQSGTIVKAVPSDFNYLIPDQSGSSITLRFRTGEYSNWRYKLKEFSLVIDSSNFSNIQSAINKVDRMTGMLESNKQRATADCNYCSRLLLGLTCAPGWKRCTYCGLTFCCRVCEEDYGHTCREGEMVTLK